MKKLPVVFLGFLLLLQFSTRLGFAQTPTNTPTPSPTQSPEIFFPVSSSVCNDLGIEYKTEETQSYLLTPTPTPTTPSSVTPTGQSQIQGTTREEKLKDFSGNLSLQSADFPDFSSMEETLSLALERGLSLAKKNVFSISGPALKTKFKHFVSGKDKAGNLLPAEKVPESEATQPIWFTRLLGLTRILCGLSNTCSPPKSLAIRIEQPNLPPISSKAGCLPGQDAPGQPLDSLNNPNEEFKTQSWWEKTTETSEKPEPTTGVIRKTTKISETAQFQEKTRGYLVGGASFNAFLNCILPPGVASSDNYVLKNNANLSLPEYYQTKSGEQALNFQNLAAVRSFCLEQCIAPPGINISSIYPFCPSCNPDDYPVTSIYDVPLDTAFCNHTDNNACNYGTSDRVNYEGCGPEKDPLCESGWCNPYEYGPAIDYTQRNPPCPLPYAPATDCYDSSVCHLVEFKPNPSGGFGACRYTSSRVCIRVDREAVGYCAAVCNWQCCQ